MKKFLKSAVGVSLSAVRNKKIHLGVIFFANLCTRSKIVNHKFL